MARKSHTWHKPTRSRIAACATGVGQDQTRKNKACLAQRWAGSVLKNPVPFITVRYACVDRSASVFAALRIWPAGSAPASPRAWAMSCFQSVCQFSQRTSSGSASSVLRRLDRRKRSQGRVRLAESECRRLKPSRADCPRLRHHVDCRACEQVRFADLERRRASLPSCTRLEAPPGQTEGE